MSIFFKDRFGWEGKKDFDIKMIKTCPKRPLTYVVEIDRLYDQMRQVLVGVLLGVTFLQNVSK